MKRGVLQFTACVVAAGMTFTGAGSVAFAAKDTALVGLGSKEKDTENQDSSDAQTDAKETGKAGELAFAQCEEYINVRSGADTDSDVVGKIYNNGSATIVSQSGDWYEVKSGNVTGYVKAEYFATGEEAEEIANDVAYNVATVYPEALTIRSGASETSDSIGTAYASDELEVVEYKGDWMKVALGNNNYGYINAYYVGYDTYYSTAETLEEEQQRLASAKVKTAQDQASYSQPQAASAQESWYEEPQPQYQEVYTTALAAGSDAQADYYYEDYYEEPVADYYDYDAQQAQWDAEWQAQQEQQAAQQAQWDAEWQEEQNRANAQANADSAYDTYLAAQAAADEAATQGDEQAVYDTAEQAEAAYEAYLAAQAEADEAAQYNDYSDYSSTGDTSAEESYYEESYEDASTGDTYTEESYYEESYEDSYTEENYYEESYEDTYTEESYEEPAQETYTSSTGEAIVAFATQFVGNPYVWGGTSLTNGADCSGFTQSVFANFGIGLPRTAAEQSYSGTPVSLSDIQPGDLLFYEGSGGIGHVTIYMGGGQVVHASNESTGITISSYGYRTPCCARRYW